MSESCTLFCKELGEDVELILNRLASLSIVELKRSDEPKWTGITCVTAAGTVQLNRLFFVERADRFSKLVWTTVVKVMSKREVAPEATKQVEGHLEATNMILGIVADPGFDEIDNLPEVIGKLGIELDALIFNGHEFLDFFGNPILSV